MHFFKSKLFLALVCLVLAAAIAFLLLPRLYENKTEIVTILKPAYHRSWCLWSFRESRQDP